MKKISISHNIRAFTLLETMIAVAIFGISILVGLLLMSFAVKTTRANRQTAYVNRILETTLENVRNLSWVELTAQPVSQSFDATNPLLPLFGKAVNSSISTSADYQAPIQNSVGKIIIDTVSGRSNLRKVTVSIERDSIFNGKKITNTLTTLISENGVDRR